LIRPDRRLTFFSFWSQIPISFAALDRDALLDFDDPAERPAGRRLRIADLEVLDGAPAYQPRLTISQRAFIFISSSAESVTFAARRDRCRPSRP
jgi:hypothetical protein